MLVPERAGKSRRACQRKARAIDGLRPGGWRTDLTGRRRGIDEAGRLRKDERLVPAVLVFRIGAKRVVDGQQIFQAQFHALYFRRAGIESAIRENPQRCAGRGGRLHQVRYLMIVVVPYKCFEIRLQSIVEESILEPQFKRGQLLGSVFSRPGFG